MMDMFTQLQSMIQMHKMSAKSPGIGKYCYTECLLKGSYVRCEEDCFYKEHCLRNLINVK